MEKNQISGIHQDLTAFKALILNRAGKTVCSACRGIRIREAADGKTAEPIPGSFCCRKHYSPGSSLEKTEKLEYNNSNLWETETTGPLNLTLGTNIMNTPGENIPVFYQTDGLLLHQLERHTGKPGNILEANRNTALRRDRKKKRGRTRFAHTAAGGPVHERKMVARKNSLPDLSQKLLRQQWRWNRRSAGNHQQAGLSEGFGY